MAIEDGSTESNTHLPAGIRNQSAVAVGTSSLFKDVGSSIAASTSTSFVVFLTAGLAVQIRSSFHFGADAFGLSIAVYYLGAAIGSIPFGRLAEAIGGVRVMKPTALIAALLLVLIGARVNSWLFLTIVLFFAGAASAAMQPATNLFLARRVPSSKQGLAFGVKQAAIPLASLLGGLAVPGIALTVGWRWAFIVAAFLSVGAAILVPKSQTSFAAYRAAHKDSVVTENRVPLIVLGVGFGLSVFAAGGLTAFVVTSGVATGLSKADAGFVGGIAGGVALFARVMSGILADRRGKGHFKVVAGMLSIGVLGFIALAIGASTHSKWLFVVGAVVAFGAGWGWNGLFNYAVIRTNQKSPARATGITQVGGRLSGVFGPLTFGLIVAHGSYAAAWIVSGTASLIGAAVILYGRSLMFKSIEREATS